MTTLIEMEHETRRVAAARGRAARELAADRITRDGPSALAGGFWADFHARFWEKEAVVLRQALARPLATAGETFRALAVAGERYRTGRRGAPLAFCIEHSNLLADVGRHLPGPDDPSVDAYVARVTRQIDGRRFGLIVDELQVEDPALWLRLREFLRPLYRVAGRPGEQAKAGVFFGNYESTPYGLHRGRSGVFQFVVRGRKRILAWPDAFFRGKEDMTYRLDYGRYLDDAIVLEGEPGDVLYWPSDHWHVGEDVGGLTMAISVMIFPEPSLAPDLVQEAARMLDERIDVAHRAAAAALRAGVPPSARGIATAAARATRALRQVTADPQLGRSLLVARLNQATGFGFTAVPEPLPGAPLADDDVVRGHREYPVLWVVSHGRLICSANGRAFAMGAHPGLVRLLRWVNSGRRRAVGRLLAEGAGRGRGAVAAADDARALLDKLRSLRALEVVPR